MFRPYPRRVRPSSSFSRRRSTSFHANLTEAEKSTESETVHKLAYFGSGRIRTRELLMTIGFNRCSSCFSNSSLSLSTARAASNCSINSCSNFRTASRVCASASRLLLVSSRSEQYLITKIDFDTAEDGLTCDCTRFGDVQYSQKKKPCLLS